MDWSTGGESSWLGLAESSETMLTKKSKISVATTAEATSSLWRVRRLPSIVIIQDLLVSSSMKSSQALENTMGASPDIIFTSSLDFFMIFFILASGSKWGPVFPDIPPDSIPEYVPGCLIFSLFFFSFFFKFFKTEGGGGGWQGCLWS